MYILALLSVTIVSLLSFVGVVFLAFKKNQIEKVMSPLLALSSGVLLGSTFFDLIPEGMELIPDNANLLIIIGIITFFCLEKLMHWHHHTEGDHPNESKSVGYLSLIGDGIHNFIDGVMIGAAFLISVPLGISVTIAVIAHEIPHELADFAILLHSGFSMKQAVLFNFLSAVTAVIGTILVLGISSVEKSFVPYLIPFAAGNFLYIAMTDLIPELHKHRTHIYTFIHIAAIIAGVMLIALLPKG